MSDRRRKRITYRPSKAQSTFAGIVGIIFVIIGVVIVIPTFGLFGLLWTGIAVAITVMSFTQGHGKNYMGPDIIIEEEGDGFSSYEENSPAGETERRLSELRALYDQRLITQEEYDRKREEILNEL